MWIPRPIDEVWAWGSDPKNLSKISPKFFGLSVGPEAKCEKGAQFDISFSVASIPTPLKWKVRISEVIAEGPKRLFVDEMLSGPFSLWRHEHRFETGITEFQTGDGKGTLKPKEPGTWLRDSVEYIPLVSALGEISDKLLIRRQLESLFVFRRQEINKIFGMSLQLFSTNPK